MNSRNAFLVSEKLNKGIITSEELVKESLKRMKEDTLGSIVSINEESAINESKNLEDKSSKLKGIPILLKDNILQKGKKTTAASKMLENYVATYDATVVEKLKKAGLPILGNCNMDEFAMGSSNENSYLGKVKNYWDNERIPGGSSGGSATAVASNIALFALGSDTGGSVRQPASLSGVVGLKPTYGRVSRYGLMAFASSLDQIGIFANNAKDTSLLLEIIAGYDEKDSTSANVDVPSYVDLIDNDINGKVIGLPKEYFTDSLDENIKQNIFETIEKLKKLGAKFKEISLPHTKYAISAYYIISSAEAASNLSRYDGIRYGYRSSDSNNIEDLYVNSRTEGFGTEVKRRIMIGNYVLSSGFYDAYYKKASQIRRLMQKDFEKAFEDVDLILTPTSPTTAFKFGEKIKDPVNMYLADIYTVSINLVGLPAISVPTGLINGLPTSIQLIGNYFREDEILNVAHKYEEIRGNIYE